MLGGVNGAKRRPSRKAPEDWSPTQRLLDRLKVECPHVDLERALRMMRNHTFGVARVDWEGTFENWVLKEAEKKPQAPRQLRGGLTDSGDNWVPPKD